MTLQTSYLQQRRQERRWRVITALVVAGALAAAAVWILERHAAGNDGMGAITVGVSASPAAAPAGTALAVR